MPTFKIIWRELLFDELFDIWFHYDPLHDKFDVDPTDRTAYNYYIIGCLQSTDATPCTLSDASTSLRTNYFLSIDDIVIILQNAPPKIIYLNVTYRDF